MAWGYLGAIMKIVNGQYFCSEPFIHRINQVGMYECTELCWLCGCVEICLIWDQSNIELQRKGKRTFALFYQLPAMPDDSVKTELKMPSFELQSQESNYA